MVSLQRRSCIFFFKWSSNAKTGDWSESYYSKWLLESSVNYSSVSHSDMHNQFALGIFFLCSNLSLSKTMSLSRQNSGMPHMDHDSSFSHGKRKRLNVAGMLSDLWIWWWLWGDASWRAYGKSQTWMLLLMFCFAWWHDVVCIVLLKIGFYMFFFFFFYWVFIFTYHAAVLHATSQGYLLLESSFFVATHAVLLSGFPLICIVRVPSLRVVSLVFGLNHGYTMWDPKLDNANTNMCYIIPSGKQTWILNINQL